MPRGTRPDPHLGGSEPRFWLLALITLSGTTAMHIFVPALPGAALALRAGPWPVQLTISIYIADLALSQLFYGPVSDV
jgi:MFS transporter, DHA1 family, multidrug resistance protein